ncbi:hypothetical protein [Mycolicibacterium llatzerense]|uniref:hypothetical protein n=1 Tax=Mycolicibacterium llatzerense TaxID=280871 RepID=UPI0013A6A973|nr:hypothetical protein [Mycolicibacterium llatzerense]
MTDTLGGRYGVPVRQIRLSGLIGAVAPIVAGVLMAGFTLAAPAANAIPNPHCGDGENYDQSGCPGVGGTYIPDPGNDRSLGARRDACAIVNSGETDALTIANKLIARYHITASEADAYVRGAFSSAAGANFMCAES